MKKIDIEKWKSFCVGDLFDIHPTKAYKLTNKDLFDEGDTPVVVNSAYNNGIGGNTTQAPTEKGNKITFSDTVDANTIFYQENDFVGYPHVQGLYPKGKFKGCWTKNKLLFFAVVFRKAALTRGFDFGNKFRRDIALKLPVLLPVCVSGTPDFEAMENYIQTREDIAKNKLDLLQNVSNEKIGGGEDLSKWKYFHLYDEKLFDIDSGTKLDRIKMTTYAPSVNFVGRANANNGVTDFIDEISGLKPYPAGVLTLSLGGEYLGSCFVQEKPFYTSQNVNVLIPRVPMSFYCKKFIATMIFKEGRLHYKAFIDELNRHIKRDFAIPLPVTADGSPDFEFMEFFMKKIHYRQQRTLNSLSF